tara:strand:- start:1692 stop:1925 length:234 start_codon:yes stop_codon:yes gene_type:complete
MEIAVIWLITIMGLQAELDNKQAQIDALTEKTFQLSVHTAAQAARSNTYDEAHEGSINKIIDVINTEVFKQPSKPAK